MPEHRLDHLRLGDLSDREILLVLDDVADDEGYANAHDIAAQLAMIGDHPNRSVSVRLSWLARYGAVERELLWDEHGNPLFVGNSTEQRRGQRWRMTPIGEALATGSLKRAQERALDELTDEQLLLATRVIAERARSSRNATSGKLAEREWKHRWLRVNGYPH
jgi:hypothetical protein